MYYHYSEFCSCFPAQQERNPRRNKKMEVSHCLYLKWLFRYNVHKCILPSCSNVKQLKTKGMCIVVELNAKGVILQAFEEYRLRSCVDFKPYEGESSYISFTKQSGWGTLYRGITQLYMPHFLSSHSICIKKEWKKVNWIAIKCFEFPMNLDAGHMLEMMV